MLLDLKTNGISRALALYKTREKDKVFLINKLNLKGKNVLDLGANIGYYSLILSENVGDKGSVFCIEPDPRNIKILKANCALYGSKNIKQIHQVALSEKKGYVDLFLTDKSNLSTLINKKNQLPKKKQKKVKVQCLSYKDFLEESKLKSLDLVRMDIEGYEQYIIPQILEINPNCKILFEVHSINYSKEFNDYLKKISNKYKLEYAISTQGGKSIIEKEFNISHSFYINSDKRKRYVFQNIKSELISTLISHNPRVLRYALITKK